MFGKTVSAGVMLAMLLAASAFGADKAAKSPNCCATKTAACCKPKPCCAAAKKSACCKKKDAACCKPKACCTAHKAK